MNTTSKSSGNPVPMKGFSSSQLRTLTFGPSFNQPLSGELPELRSLRFGHDWNHPLDFLSFPKLEESLGGSAFFGGMMVIFGGRIGWFSQFRKRESPWNSVGEDPDLGCERDLKRKFTRVKHIFQKQFLRKGRVSWIELVVCLPTLDMEISSRGLERLANWRKRISLKS